MTTAPSVKAALLTALQASASLTGVHVQRGLPADLPDSPEHVYITTDVDHRRIKSHGNLTHRLYDITLIVEVIGNRQLEDAELRVRQIESAVATVVSDKLRVTNTSATLNTGDLDEHIAATDGWIVRCRPTVSVVAY